ncbi:2,3-dihydro-2,3-dihydroxybenzoate dehydrogenase [Microbulbifer aggregans]|uniref:2,3-dihydro-2,3-dihydroxybenzoate dehydrogenase n=1 Tax=Microbulbifer aggregans TaxID=1769779 RepID=UPI001CFCD424|nr:2,3-dihydro-2,3-dihydroxybenzoate dehydrogenase [Microbulbifer aggregans]
MSSQKSGSANGSVWNFKNKSVWIVGAAGGIGRAVADNFQQLGARVIGFDRDFEHFDVPYVIRQLNIADPYLVAATVRELLQDNLGPEVLVNAAGTLHLGSIDSQTENCLTIDDWHRCLDTNVSGVFYLLRNLATHFKQQRSGAIVNIASNAARVPRKNMAAYCASKAALQSLSHCIALELAEYNVRCNLVSPGSTDTPMLQTMLTDVNGDTSAGYLRTIEGLPEDYKLGIPLKKIATSQEIANAILFLASDAASHITMQNIVVDGGATLAA